MSDAWGGAFGDAWGASWGSSAPEPSPVVVTAPDAAGGSKAKRKVRGPYSDPRIFEEYIARCIAEREAPRVNVEKAVLQEALVEIVDERARAQQTELSSLIRENKILGKLISLERAKRSISAIASRQAQIRLQIQRMQDEEDEAILSLLQDL